MNLENIWESFLEKLKPQISSLSYDTWFKDTKLLSLDGNIAKILVDSPMQRKQLKVLMKTAPNFLSINGLLLKPSKPIKMLPIIWILSVFQMRQTLFINLFGELSAIGTLS